MLMKENYDNSFADWCGKKAEHVAARQNHTDAGVMAVQKKSGRIVIKIELSREYDEERWTKLDGRLEKMEQKMSRLAPVNMAKTIENAIKDCMQEMVGQVTDQVVGRLEKLAEKEKMEEIRSGKQVEATPVENFMSNIEFGPWATFLQKENKKVNQVLKHMVVENQDLEQSKHALVIPRGGVKG